jgi:predicted transcriptional regulator
MKMHLSEDALPKELDRKQERERFLLAVHEGLADARAGRLAEDREIERVLDEEFGLLEPP